jgi:hypothetical protein
MIILSRHLQRNTCKRKINWLLLGAVIYQPLLQCLMGFLLPLFSVCQQVHLQISFISLSHLHIHLPLALLELLYHVFLHGSNRPNSPHGSGTEAFFHSSPSSSSSPSVNHSLHHPGMSANTTTPCSSWMQDTARQSNENNVSGDFEDAKDKNRGNSHVQMPSMDSMV